MNRNAAIRVYEAPYQGERKRGICAWCGERMANPDGSKIGQRIYCYLEREGRDCRGDVSRSIVWTGRDAIVRYALYRQYLGLICRDCGIVVAVREGRHMEDVAWTHATFKDVRHKIFDPAYPPWEADHKVALIDGGEHTLANLCVRCVPCHRLKSAEESRARAQRRKLTS